MKQLVIIAVVFLSLLSGASLADEDFYGKADKERLKAAKSYARAHVLVAGIKGNNTIRRKIYSSAIEKVEKYVASADDHLAKAREYYLKGYHNGNIGELPATKLKDQLKKQKVKIAELRSSIDELHTRFSKNKKKVKDVVKGPERAVAVNDFLDWLDFVKQLQKTESKKWSSDVSTKKLWKQAAEDSGFYGVHIDNLANSVIYADSRKNISQQDYDYVRDGMRRFMGFHDQLIALLEKIKVAHNADLEGRQRWAEVYVRPYLSQKVFSGLPIRKVIPELPRNPAENLGYIPPQPMMRAFKDLPKNPSLQWIKRDKNVMQVLRALYDRGFAHEFINKFVSLDGRFTVEITNDSSDNEVVYFAFDSTLYISKDRFINDRLNIDPDLLADLLHELFHAYSNTVIDAGKDPLTKNLLVNIETWLGEQFIRQDASSGGSRAWVNFADNIVDAKGFTENYVGEIINVAFSKHVSLWNKRYQKSRDSRITVKQATTDWAKQQSEILNAEYSASQAEDEIRWEVQTVPPAFVLNYINAFYGFGEY